jgi:hypothetical protein
MVHAALLLLMLEAVTHGPRFTISLKRSTQNFQLSTSCRPITPSFGNGVWVTQDAISVTSKQDELQRQELLIVK